jgi:hypothetical protein
MKSTNSSTCKNETNTKFDQTGISKTAFGGRQPASFARLGKSRKKKKKNKIQ